MYTIQNVIQLHQQGKLVDAEKGYRALLGVAPDNANVNFYFGKLLLDTKRAREASPFLQKAHAFAPSNESVLLLYSECLIALENTSLALRLLEPAINVSVNAAKLFLKAHYQTSKEFNSTQLYDRLLAHWNNDLSIIICMAQLYEGSSYLNRAEREYERLLEKDPVNILGLHNLATIRRRLGDPASALSLLLRAHECGLKSFQLFHNLGNAYSDLNALDNAINAYKSAIALNPYYTDSYANLTAIFAEQGYTSRFVDLFESALSQNIRTESLLLTYIDNLLRVGSIERVEELLKHFSHVFSNSDAVKLRHAKVSYLKGNIKDASDLLSTTHTQEAILQRAEYALQIEETDFLFDQMPLLCEPPTSSVMAKAYLTVAERLIGRNGHRESYCYYETLVKEYTLPDRFADMSKKAFCLQLSELLNSKHTAKAAPLEQTLNGGTQTRGNIFNQNKGTILTELEEFCSSSVRKYIRDLLTQNSLHQYCPKPFTDFEYVGAWSVKLNNDGYHTNHVHPEGTLSAVFYVDIPKNLDEEKEEGYLTFGRPNFETLKELSHEYSIRPETGKLVIFPSYCWHGTIPFTSDEQRLTIAFDVAPANYHNN